MSLSARFKDGVRDMTNKNDDRINEDADGNTLDDRDKDVA